MGFCDVVGLEIGLTADEMFCENSGRDFGLRIHQFAQSSACA